MQRYSTGARYRGPLQAVLFDWAGTTIDFGSRAPTATFVRVFADEGVAITEAEAREPMGMAKRAHIETLLQMPAVAERWRQAHRRAPTSVDVDRLYVAFLPMQLKCLTDYADLLPGAADVVAACRQRGMKIGSSTGYVREMMDVLMPLAERQGYRPDEMLCASDLKEGRPAPWLNLENARRLGVFPLESIVIVDDTRVGIEAGRNAGMWTVGVIRTGNEVGLSRAALEALASAERDKLCADAAARLAAAGAHYTIDSVADLLPVLDEIERRLAAGERP
ncbi:MAG: phosphonoacetaldehyde hydrolase [Planctomycetes bacterium]|nr:phosphonoacetaldehyde hydrolase [Planctomycetota bacterium]